MSWGVGSGSVQPNRPPSGEVTPLIALCWFIGVQWQQRHRHRLSDEAIWLGLETSLASCVADREPAAELAFSKRREKVREYEAAWEHAAAPRYCPGCAHE